MAGATLLSLLDDIASLLDDVGTMAQMATEKTAGVLGDDLALNAEQVSGVRADRELPVVFAVAKGSAKNKLILVPVALLISAFVPALITPLLMVGGLYLCFEGFEKILHAVTGGHDDHASASAHDAPASTSTPANGEASASTNTAKKKHPPMVDEAARVKGAIRTDFVLSAEIVTITLGTVQDAELVTQILVVSGIAALMTVGVYGFVAVIVKADDVGVYLLQTKPTDAFIKVRHMVGRGILKLAPVFIRLLTYVGTIAMFLVGGGILMHGLTPVHHVVEPVITLMSTEGESLLKSALTTLSNGLLGVIAGALTVAVVTVVNRLRKKDAPPTSPTLTGAAS